jgi:hypothetical protein
MERVTDEQVAELAQLFHEFDESAFSHSTLDRMSKMAEDLARRYATTGPISLGAEFSWCKQNSDYES